MTFGTTLLFPAFLQERILLTRKRKCELFDSLSSAVLLSSGNPSVILLLMRNNDDRTTAIHEVSFAGFKCRKYYKSILQK